MHTPRISLIAALSENRVIGKDNKVPWRIVKDLVRLKQLTTNHAVILGRKTYESMIAYYNQSGNQLPGRIYIVVTSQDTFQTGKNNCLTAQSIDSAIEKAKTLEKEEIFIIGGGEIFAKTIGIADRLYLTVVHAEIVGDAYFPDYSEFSKVIFQKDQESDEYTYTFYTLEKDL